MTKTLKIEIDKRIKSILYSEPVAEMLLLDILDRYYNEEYFNFENDEIRDLFRKEKK